MIYPFECRSCGFEDDFVMHHTEYSPNQSCSKCGGAMSRVFTTPNLSVSLTGYFDHGLGRWIGSRQDVKDEMKRYTDRTGSELVEIGDDRREDIKNSRRKEYKLPREVLDVIDKA